MTGLTTALCDRQLSLGVYIQRLSKRVTEMAKAPVLPLELWQRIHQLAPRNNLRSTNKQLYDGLSFSPAVMAEHAERMTAFRDALMSSPKAKRTFQLLVEVIRIDRVNDMTYIGRPLHISSAPFDELEIRDPAAFCVQLTHLLHAQLRHDGVEQNKENVALLAEALLTQIPTPSKMMRTGYFPGYYGTDVLVEYDAEEHSILCTNYYYPTTDKVTNTVMKCVNGVWSSVVLFKTLAHCIMAFIATPLSGLVYLSGGFVDRAVMNRRD